MTTENTPTPAELSAEARGMMQRQEWMPAELAIRMADMIDALAATLTEAPHDVLRCRSLDPLNPGLTCTCWKSKLPADAMDAGRPEEMREWRPVTMLRLRADRIEREAAK